MIKNKILILITLSMCVNSFLLHADDSTTPCLKKDGKVNLNGLEKYDCKLVKAAANATPIKESFQKNIWTTLADSISLKSIQRLEEIALLDQYFSQNNSDLSLDSEDVMRNCRLDKIAKPVCDKNSKNFNLKNYEEKLKILTSKFPSSDESKNLLERMRNKFSGMREVEVKGNTCPISGASGYFQISSQLTESEAQAFVTSIKQSGSKIHNFADKRDLYYESFPQLRLLRASLKNGPAGEENLKEFEQKIKNFDEKSSPLKLINTFLFSEKAKIQLAISLSAQCKDVSSNIKNFVCDDFSTLAMPKELSNDYFAINEDETNTDISKAFSCNPKNELSEEDFRKSLIAPGTIASLDSEIKNDIRKPKDEFVAVKAVTDFCNFYSCKTPESKILPSCKAGGPVISKDIIDIYCKDSMSSACITNYMSYISYLSSIEKDKKVRQEIIQSFASNGPMESSDKSKGHSSFYENFVSVGNDISPLQENKKLLSIVSDDRKIDSIERKSDLVAQNSSLSQPKETIKQIAESHEEALPSSYENSSGSASARDSDQFRKSFSPQFSKSSDAPQTSGKTKKNSDSGINDYRMDELKKLRSDLTDAISKVKGTDEEKLAAVADNNESVITPKGAKKDSTKNLNQGEKDRLDSYRDSLNNWESRLRNWQGQLSDKDVRVNSSGANSTNEVHPTAAGEQLGGSGSGTSSVKLSKTSAASMGAAGGKADVSGERTPGSEKSDLEQGIVNSESLKTLQKETLTKLGIVLSDSFVIKVRFQDKIYAIPVKTFSHDGKSMFVPLLNEKNKELSKIVYESPLFRDYRNYQVDRQYKLEARN